MENADDCILTKSQFMMKKMFVVLALMSTSVTFAQQKKIKQPPAPPPPVEDIKQIPPPPPKPTEPLPLKETGLPQDYQAFLKKNPAVKGVGWSNKNVVHIRLKSGKEELYDLNNEEDAQKLKNKYGELPVPPPPPPPPKAPKKRTQA